MRYEDTNEYFQREVLVIEWWKHYSYWRFDVPRRFKNISASASKSRENSARMLAIEKDRHDTDIERHKMIAESLFSEMDGETQEMATMKLLSHSGF